MSLFNKEERNKELNKRRRQTDTELSKGQQMLRTHIRKANVHLSVLTDVITQTKRVDIEQLEELKKTLKEIRQADILLSSFHLYGKEGREVI